MLRDRPPPPGRENAEAIAVSALNYLAGDQETLGRFLALAGIGPGALRDIAGKPEFLRGVMDFMVSDEALLKAFAGAAGIGPEEVAAAQRILEGS